MKLLSVRLARTFSLVLAPAALVAQQFDNTAIPIEFLETSPWTVSAGARFSTEGATVNFGQLGRVSTTQSAPPPGFADENGNTKIPRFYDDGAIGVDGLRGNEMDVAGNQLPSVNGRYQGRFVDSNGNETFAGDFLSYQDGRTRAWSAASESQVSGDTIAMHLYSSQSTGATAMSDSTASGGVEIAVNRRIRRFGRRVELGIGGLFALNDIDAGARETITADLIATTDFYRMYGTSPEEFPYTGPTFEDWTGPNGQKVTNGRETTTAIDQIAFERQIITIPDGAIIDGAWKINGAYYVVRAGPMVRVFITNRLAVSFEAGFAAAFVGTDYEVREAMELPGLEKPLVTTEEDETSKVLTGFYGAGAVEYWMTERTNAYAGAAYESLDSYQQSVNGRTAEIDVGSTVTVRMGLTTRF